MFWTLDRIVNINEERLDILIKVLSEYQDNYDRVGIFGRLIELGYISKKPVIPEGETKKSVYEKKWGSYVVTVSAYAIAKFEDGKIHLSDLAKDYDNGRISFEEYIRIVMSRWQLPNGGLAPKKINEYLAEGILIKPYILVLQVLYSLHVTNRYEGWIDSYDISEHIYSAKDNSYRTVNDIVGNILEDRTKKNIERKYEANMDVIFNTICATGYVIKNLVPKHLIRNITYSLNVEKLDEIRSVIENNLDLEFNDQSDILDKEKWHNYFGGSIDNINNNDNTLEINEKIKGHNLILFGSPGTGKSHELDRRYSNNTLRVTFHPEYTYHDFVGSYRPVPIYKEVLEGVVIKDHTGKRFPNGEPLINYEFVPGPFTLALESSYRNRAEEHTLIIEEINRANASAVFGDIFQLLDRNITGDSTYSITHLEVAHYLKNKGIRIVHNEIRVPNNLNIVSTMNSSDQGVSVLDSAFKRRWNFEYLPITFEGVAHANELVDYGGGKITWKNFIETINDFLSDNNINEDKLIGPYFMKSGEPTNKEIISSKLLIYLWDDVVRTKRKVIFNEDIKTFSQLVEKYLVLNEEIFNCTFTFEIEPQQIVQVDDNDET